MSDRNRSPILSNHRGVAHITNVIVTRSCALAQLRVKYRDLIFGYIGLFFSAHLSNSY